MVDMYLEENRSDFFSLAYCSYLYFVLKPKNIVLLAQASRKLAFVFQSVAGRSTA